MLLLHSDFMSNSLSKVLYVSLSNVGATKILKFMIIESD